MLASNKQRDGFDRVELIRMAYRLASTFASLRCLPPGSPAVITCQDTIVAVEQLAHALSSVSSVSSSWNAIQVDRIVCCATSPESHLSALDHS